MMQEHRQKWLLEYSERAGDRELFNKVTWLNKHKIELNGWQLTKFTGCDRGVGKTYVSMLLNTYHGTEDPYLDPDAHRSYRTTREYLRMLKDFKKHFHN